MQLAKREAAIVVLKGKNTITTDGVQVIINPTGNQGMATAGSGDALTGVIASLLAQGASTMMAAACGAYVHGLAGDIAVKATGDRGMVASDIVKALPEAFKTVTSET